MFEVVLGRVRRLAGVSLVLLLPAIVYAQAPREARVHVTVVDPTGGVIPTATVTLVGLDAATETLRRLLCRQTRKASRPSNESYPGATASRPSSTVLTWVFCAISGSTPARAAAS